MGLKYYVIDCETTGFSPKYHEITEISIIRCDDRNQLSLFLKPQFPQRANPESLRVTGRTFKDLFKGIHPKEAVDKINQFVESDQLTPEHRCFIGHNVQFDRGFVYFLWNSFGKEFPATCWLDTKTMTKKWATQLGIERPKLTLGASLELVGIKAMPGVHNAVADTRNTYLLWKKGIENGIDYLPALKRFPQFSSSSGSASDDISLAELVAEGLEETS